MQLYWYYEVTARRLTGNRGYKRTGSVMNVISRQQRERWAYTSHSNSISVVNVPLLCAIGVSQKQR
jgi:hypothetical protein